MRVVIARDNFVLCRPCDCCFVVRAGLNVLKLIFSVRFGQTLHSVNRRCEHSARYIGFRLEVILAHSRHSLGVIRFLNRRVVPRGFGNILEPPIGSFTAAWYSACFSEFCVNSYRALGLYIGVSSVRILRNLYNIAVLVLDDNVLNIVALVGCYGYGYGVARVCAAL